MDEIQIYTTFPNIPPENLENFKKLVSQAVAITKDDDETLRYDYFLSDNGTKCVSPHAHVNSEALLAHIGKVGELLGPMVELGGGVEVVVLGDPSAELLEATAAFEATVYAHLDGK
ncbi:MAG: hypothetical protein GXP35_01100 [Actinobacteria bacterium]|nr:hypothetical protein [Actinomycetota bacterium]